MCKDCQLVERDVVNLTRWTDRDLLDADIQYRAGVRDELTVEMHRELGRRYWSRRKHGGDAA